MRNKNNREFLLKVAINRNVFEINLLFFEIL